MVEGCFIIAEAGVNHNGNIDIAKRLIDAAYDAGANAIKFQSFITDKLVTRNAPKADYQLLDKKNENQYEMLKKLELSYESHFLLKEYCEKKGIIFISTPFDFESVDLLEELSIPFYKISSGDLDNTPLLKYIATLNKPMVVSTGMSSIDEIREAVQAIRNVGNENITLLQCTSNYPTDYSDVNLNSMIMLRDTFNLPVGFSDHTIGIEVPIAAVAMGAKIIEKHFTLDKDMEGPDHKASLNTEELKRMITSIRNVEKAFGDYKKEVRKSEINVRGVARKSIVASKKITKGEKITYKNLTFKRPGIGLSPSLIDSVIGKVAVKDICEDEIINFDNVK